MIIAVDFDGTLCENKYPEIGEDIIGMINILIMHRMMGNKVILWTCRTGERLNEAVEWCRKYGLEFDAVNENLPEIIEKFGGDSRKVYADAYLDDRSVDISYATMRRTRPMVYI